MGFPIVRYGDGAWGVLRGGEVFALPTRASTLAELLAEDVLGLVAGAGAAVVVSQFLSPVTSPCQMFARGRII
jgi:hypothetical protein